MRGLKRGVPKLGTVSPAKYFAPSLLAAFTADYPEVTIKFSVGNREKIVQQLAANEIDRVIIAAPDHALATKRRIRLKQLGTENFLIRVEGSGTRASLEHVFRDRGATYRTSMQVSGNETIKQAVMAGMGISFISMHTVGLELLTSKLVVLDVVGLPILREWYVIHLRAKNCRRSRPRSAASCWNAARRS